jgi:hypothetical protein
MANKKTTSQTTLTTDYKLVCCLNCMHAQLHRYGNNPILSACHQKPQPDNERFPYQIEVACHLRKCSYWALDHNRKTVEQRSKVA